MTNTLNNDPRLTDLTYTICSSNLSLAYNDLGSTLQIKLICLLCQLLGQTDQSPISTISQSIRSILERIMYAHHAKVAWKLIKWHKKQLMPMAAKSNDIAKDKIVEEKNWTELNWTGRRIARTWTWWCIQGLSETATCCDSSSAMVPGKTIYSPTECATMHGRGHGRARIRSSQRAIIKNNLAETGQGVGGVAVGEVW